MTRRFAMIIIGVCCSVAPQTATVAENNGAECLATTEASLAIVGGSNDDFFNRLYHREITTMTGVDVSEKSLDDARGFARDFFRDAVMPFTDQEETVLSQLVKKLRGRFGEKYARLVDRPWRFVKTRKDLCGGFSFTRGTSIVLSERTLARLVRQATRDPVDTTGGERLLLHEQLHVLQRLEPKRFQPLYEQIFGFRQATFELPIWIDTRQVTNPDGVDDQWIVASTKSEGRGYWVGTMLLTDRAVPRMGSDFVTVAVPVEERDGQHHVSLDENESIPRLQTTDALKEFVARLPIRPAFDHPNEVAAYLLTVITHGDSGGPLSDEAKQVMHRAESWFLKNLGQSDEVEDRIEDVD